MIYSNKNFSLGKLPAFQNGDEIISCNLMQALPHTLIGNGKIGLKFHDCNMVNCDVPPDAIVTESNCFQADFCYHLHPEFNLPVEPENCRHVIDIDVVKIDGAIVDTTYQREDKAA